MMRSDFETEQPICIIFELLERLWRAYVLPKVGVGLSAQLSENHASSHWSPLETAL